MEDNELISLPGWETVRRIGNGSSGNVYEIRKKDEYGGDFHCALKVISIPATQAEYDEMLSTMSEFAMRAKLREKVEEISNEYRLMGALRGHPNIVNCEDQMIIPHENDLGWDIYIRMELLTSLPDYVQEHGMTMSDVLKLGNDICAALELCRENNIIHRDIKPQNIFVSRYGVFKLGDFGVAKVSSINGSADKVGTYSYMAPEVYTGKSYNGSVDIYSLGMVLYWLLNERRGPFLPLPPATPTTEQIADAQLRRYRGEALPPPINGNTALKKLVQKACSYNPEKRYSSPTEMKTDLSLASFGKSVDDILRESDKKPVEEPKPQEHSVKAAAKPAPVVVTPKPAAPPVTPQPEPEQKKSMAGYVIALCIILSLMIVAVIIYFLKDDLFPEKTVVTPSPTATATAEPEETKDPKDVYIISVNLPTVDMTVGDTETLRVNCIPDRDKKFIYVWKSSDSHVVTVNDEGHIEAISPGTATVRVYISGMMEIYDECTVTVSAPKVTDLVIEENPVKTIYAPGEELDTTGLVLRAYYNDGSAKRISDPAEYSATCDMNTLGSQTVVIEYGGRTVEYKIRISIFS